MNSEFELEAHIAYRVDQARDIAARNAIADRVNAEAESVHEPAHRWTFHIPRLVRRPA